LPERTPSYAPRAAAWAGPAPSRWHAAGAHVTLNGRNEDKLKEAADLCHAAGAHGVNIVKADVSTTDGQDALMEACPKCDILINNNGGPPLKGLSASLTATPFSTA
jgi:NADP-dependent 3-hydroxy acid dehydrogenase YdfG